MRTWTLFDAKNKFSEVVNRALTEGPQAVTRRGKSAVIVVSTREFQRLVDTANAASPSAPPKDLWEFLRSLDLGDLEIDYSHRDAPARDISFMFDDVSEDE